MTYGYATSAGRKAVYERKLQWAKYLLIASVFFHTSLHHTPQSHEELSDL